MTSAYMGRVTCPRCSHDVPERQAFGGCPDCLGQGVPVNVHPHYNLDDTVDVTPDENGQGIFRYRGMLPIRDGTQPVSLGEGGTRLLAVPTLGEQLGVEQLFVKDESSNPTWSYKDRLAAVAVTKAKEMGADTVVVATTGNHGAAAAAYAAAASLRCVVLTLESVPLTMKVQMQSYGADVVALREPPQRWALMAQAVAERGWVPLSGYVNPPVGSNPFGIDGYKTIAYELVEAMGRPDVVVVPAAYGDGLAGIHRGFTDLVALGRIPQTPRMVAAEPFGPYAAALAAGGDVSGRVPVQPSVAFSTATPVATHQGMAALRDSGGTGRAVPDDAAILQAQRLAASTCGLYMEAAAALCLPVVQELVADGGIARDDRVVILGTSTGLKDVTATARTLPPTPVIEPTLRALDVALEQLSR